MAEFIDDIQEDENLQDAETEEFSSLDEEPEEVTPYEEPEDEDEEDDIPEKYRGKSAKDIVRMHQEAEKLLGRQSSEVGELRKLVDNFILSQTQSAKPTEEEDDVDFFEDPQKAVERAIAKHPKIKAAEEMASTMRQQSVHEMLKAKHPDFGSILNNPAFAEWVQSSKVRLELFARADQQYDFDAADELLSTYKERMRIVDQTKEVEEKEIKRQRKAASTGRGNGSGEGRSRKVYRRADIINLMQNDPSRYLELADEITLAYSEGRVK